MSTKIVENSFYPIPAKNYVIVKSDEVIKIISVLKMDGSLILKSNFISDVFYSQNDLGSHQAGQNIIMIEFLTGITKSEIIQILH